MSYLRSITLVKTSPCLAAPGKLIIVGQPDRSLEEAIPFLAALPGVISYNPETLSLTFRRAHGFMTIIPNRVYITQVNDSEEGLMLLVALVEAINATWEKRAELGAVTNARRSPRWLDIWALLPQTNCRQCDELTCMAFAAALLQQKRAVAECLPLVSNPAFEDRRTALEEILR